MDKRNERTSSQHLTQEQINAINLKNIKLLQNQVQTLQRKVADLEEEIRKIKEET